MSTNRDFDRIAAAWLAEGPSELADRVLEDALAEVHLTHQRHGLILSPTFLRRLPVRLAAAAALVVLVGGALSVLRSSIDPGQPTLSHSATSSPVPSGKIRDSGSFGEPFTFTKPVVDGSGSNAGLPQQLASRPTISTGLYLLNGPWFSIRFVDDLPIPVDLCDRTGAVLPDVPSTPAAVGEWLEAERPMRIRSWVVSGAEPVIVDGRTALRWDLGESVEDAACLINLPATGETWGEMLLRVYAIPTGDDTILLIGGSDMVNFDAVSDAMDDIVRSMKFN